MPASTFHVAHTADFYDAAGKLKFKDIGTEVLAGLSDGEIVVVAAPPTLNDGRRVTVGGR